MTGFARLKRRKVLPYKKCYCCYCYSNYYYCNYSYYSLLPTTLLSYYPITYHTYPPTYLPTYLPTHRPTYPPTYLPTSYLLRYSQSGFHVPSSRGIGLFLFFIRRPKGYPMFGWDSAIPRQIRPSYLELANDSRLNVPPRSAHAVGDILWISLGLFL